MVNNFNNINKTNNHISPQIIEHKKTTSYNVGNPGTCLEQIQICGGIKPVNIIRLFVSY